MFEGPENVLYNIFNSPETKPIVEASGHIYEETKITRWKTIVLTANYHVLNFLKESYLES